MPANPANRANPANLLQADAKALVVEAAAEQAIISEKRPLFRELPPPPQFPVDALGPLKEPALAIQSKTQAPIAICAQSVLAVATLAVQAHIDVELPGGGIKPAVNMFVSIAEARQRFLQCRDAEARVHGVRQAPSQYLALSVVRTFGADRGVD